jgi:predicted RNase H-like HicB family nuclease
MGHSITANVVRPVGAQFSSSVAGCMTRRSRQPPHDAKYHGTTKEELIQNVKEILECISEDELVPIFLNWMTRLEEVIATNGEYL